MTLTSGISSSKVEPRAYLCKVRGRNPKFSVRIYFVIMACHIHFCMRGSRILFQGGGGGPGPTARKPSGQVFLVLNLFYSLQRASNGFITEKSIILKYPEGSNIFKGVQLFPRGSKC